MLTAAARGVVLAAVLYLLTVLTRSVSGRPLPARVPSDHRPQRRRQLLPVPVPVPV